MNSVRVNKSELLSIVRDNMLKHISEYNESIESYKEAVLVNAKYNLSLAKTADLSEIQKMKSFPTCPTSFEDDYKIAVRMLELSVDDVIELNEHEFKQLVLDEWIWKKAFVATTSMYKATK